MKKHFVSLNVPVEHACYKDHFPGLPIVPAALFMQWLIKSACEDFLACSVVEVRSMKFLSVVKPGDECILHLTLDETKRSLKLEAYKDDCLLCKGVMKLGAIAEGMA